MLMILCKINIEEAADCEKCCLYCENICERRCVFAKFNNYENGIICDNRIYSGNIINYIGKLKESGEEQ